MKFEKYLNNLFTSFSFLMLIRNRTVGAVLFLFSFANPSVGCHALIAYGTAVYCGRLVGLSRQQMIGGFHTYNSLLVGLSIGYQFQLTPLSVLFTVIISSFTVFISYSLSVFFTNHLSLPVLNLPFTFTATLLSLSSVSYSNLLINNTHTVSFLDIPSLPLWLSGFFKNIGTLLFMPYDIVGLCIAVAIALYSRINFFLVIMGYYSGTVLLFLLKGSYYDAFSGLHCYNFILTSVALGGFFLIPSLKSYVIAFTGSLITVIVLDAAVVFWSSAHIPVYTLPFAVATLTMLYALTVNKSRYLNHSFLETPEQNLEHFINYASRFDHIVPQPRLPFAGAWKVYQSSDDAWTHKGNWRDAIDFVVEDDDGNTHCNSGAVLEDYYCYKKPLFAPVSGTVVALCNDCEDNVPGRVDQVNNWGNYIVIYSVWGYYVEISHCAKNSICVKLNDQVVVGTLIAECGNSGYSPQPHIHFQCQYFSYAGAPAVSFYFSSALIDNEYLLKPLPLQRGQAVAPIVPSRILERRLQFLLDDSFRYSIGRNGVAQGEVDFSVTMASDGAYYLSENRTESRLFFSTVDGIFRFYRFEGDTSSPLRFMFIALPSLPQCGNDITWHDSFNAGLVYRHNSFHSFLKSFNHHALSVSGAYTLSGEKKVEGTITAGTMFGSRVIRTTMEFDEYKGFKTVAVSFGNETFELNLVKS